MDLGSLVCKRQSEISCVFQSFHLIPTLTVAENIGFPLKISKKVKQVELTMHALMIIG